MNWPKFKIGDPVEVVAADPTWGAEMASQTSLLIGLKGTVVQHLDEVSGSPLLVDLPGVDFTKVPSLKRYGRGGPYCLLADGEIRLLEGELVE